MLASDFVSQINFVLSATYMLLKLLGEREGCENVTWCTAICRTMVVADTRDFLGSEASEREKWRGPGEIKKAGRWALLPAE